MSLINFDVQPGDIRTWGQIWFGNAWLFDAGITGSDTIAIQCIMRYMQKIGAWLPFRCADLTDDGKYNNSMAARLYQLVDRGVLRKISLGLFETTSKGKQIIFRYWPAL